MAQAHASNRAALNQANQAPAQSGGMGGVQIGQSSAASYEAGRIELLSNVQTAGDRALYRRGRQWIDSTVTDKPVSALNAQARTVAQFSEEYFQLVRSNSSVENQILAIQQPGEELIVALRGRLYRIVPPAPVR
jgi:hypothetical protein